MEKFLIISEVILNRATDFFEGSWPGADVELLEGVLTVTLPENHQYVINRHGVTYQIWLSSPFTGAHHFKWAHGAWECTRTHIELMDFLIKERRLYAT